MLRMIHSKMDSFCILKNITRPNTGKNDDVVTLACRDMGIIQSMGTVAGISA
jgi:hypothetical protein